MPNEIDLTKLAVGESIFVPTLRTQLLLWAAKLQAEAHSMRISYRMTVVDGKFGLLLTRRETGRIGIRNEDTKES